MVPSLAARLIASVLALNGASLLPEYVRRAIDNGLEDRIETLYRFRAVLEAGARAMRSGA